LSGFEENNISEKSVAGSEIGRRDVAKLLDPVLLEEFQIQSSRPRELDESKIRLIYFHDVAGDPEVAGFKDNNFKAKFNHFVFNSSWQYQHYRDYLGFEWAQNCSVIEYGFDPIVVDWAAKKADPIMKFCYFSTPQRGLGILVPIFEKFAETHEDVHLDVFSSFKIYGWEEQDKQFEPLYEKIRSHPKMTYHGSVGHDELMAYLPTAHVLAYPSTWVETSCRVLAESMSAGLLCVHSNLGALYDTSAHLTQMYQGDQNPNIHAAIFLNELNNAYNSVKGNPQFWDYLTFVKNYADNRFNINRAVFQWNGLLNSLKTVYATPESRKFKQAQFIIDTQNPKW
jgi:hypothetical protein